MVRKEESKKESVRKWKRISRKGQTQQTGGIEDQKENMRMHDHKREVQQLEEWENQAEKRTKL